MKIKKVAESYIEFDNGKRITDYHSQHCCESNYAGFKQIEEMALKIEFSENLIFERVEGYGFRFGSVGTHMFFIPCYSEQNGYYSDEVDIVYDNKIVIKDCQCDMRVC